jgi:hypothetical protein
MPDEFFELLQKSIMLGFPTLKKLLLEGFS